MMKNAKIKTQRSRGFTLVEMLVVLAILVLLVSMVAPRIIGSQKKADLQAAKTQIGLFKGSLQNYYLDCKDYPSTEQGLQALVSEPSDLPDNVKWGGPYVEGELGLDPWGHEYQYEYPPTRGNGDTPEIWSWGPDGEDGTDDDICSWSSTGSSAGEGEGGKNAATRQPRTENRKEPSASRSSAGKGPSSSKSMNKSAPREREPKNAAPVRNEPAAK
jgi:general secretion pathway protein G